MRRSLTLAVAIATALAFAPASARAQSQAEINIARQTAGEGLTAYKSGEYQKAVSLFDQARAVYPSAQILRMLGYSQLALEHWEKAIEALEAALASKVGPLGADDRKDVEEQMAKALAHYGTVDVKAKTPGAEVVIDAQPPRKLPLDKPVRLFEGKHRVVVHAEDKIDAEREIDVGGGRAVVLELDPRSKDAPPPPPPPPVAPPPPPPKKAWLPHQRTIGLAAVGAGVGVGAIGLVTGLIGNHVRSNVESDVATHQKFYGTNCAMGDPRLCAFDVQVINNEADQADALRNASLVMYVTAGVLAAGGVTLFLLAPKPAADEAAPPPVHAARLRCGIAGAGLSCGGAF